MVGNGFLSWMRSLRSLRCWQRMILLFPSLNRTSSVQDISQWTRNGNVALTTSVISQLRNVYPFYHLFVVPWFVNFFTRDLKLSLFWRRPRDIENWKFPSHRLTTPLNLQANFNLIEPLQCRISARCYPRYFRYLHNNLILFSYRLLLSIIHQKILLNIILWFWKKFRQKF